MTNKDISAIRKRFNLEKNNITVIRGCYVSSQGEIISTFSRSLRGMGQEEAEKYLAIFKKTLSGTQGKNLIDIDFDPEKMADSPEYQHLTHLKDSALKDDELVEDFYNQVIGNTGLEDPYLILLMHDGYDVPHHSKDGRVMDSDTVFHYILCAVCPVKMTKPTLSYNADRNLFTSKDADWVVSSPEIGFLFPAFQIPIIVFALGAAKRLTVLFLCEYSSAHRTFNILAGRGAFVVCVLTVYVGTLILKTEVENIEILV